MRLVLTLSMILTTFFVQAQSSTIKGQLQDAEGQAIAYANVVLYSSVDSSMLKVAASNDAGIFQLPGLLAGNYFLKSSYVGYPDLVNDKLELKDGETLDLGVLAFAPAAVELTGATVTASRALVEVKADRTVFNVQGTINSIGSDAISLLRKAPGVTVDNNDNVNVLGRSGVMIFVDGKRLPLSGADLSAYLQNLPAEQIDRMDIITNPGAKYEAEGNAGIIDIRLKKDKSHGTNGSVTGSFSQGEYARYNGSASANYRNKMMNVFATGGTGGGDRYNKMNFNGEQYNVRLQESNRMVNSGWNANLRLGTDFFINKNNTIGFLVGANKRDGQGDNRNIVIVSPITTPEMIDSILVANNTDDSKSNNQTYNVNYQFDNRKGRSLNMDFDFGHFLNTSDRVQPNQYYKDAITKENELSFAQKNFDTKIDIDIYTGKIDYEEEILGGKLGIGSKLSRVVTKNDFLVYDFEEGENFFNNDNSNLFTYKENVYAGYLNFAAAINKKWSYSAGIRAEQTDAMGELTAFNSSQVDSTLNLNYLQFFPSAGLTYQAAPMHAFSMNYGRRINRPDYSVLNPFVNRLSEISFEKGNPNLNPEIVNNFELGYTYAYRYNLKLGYSRTSDQITRLIGPDEVNELASFISWDNLAEQTIYSANLSIPVQISKIWNAFFNLSLSHKDNQGEYENGAIIDLQVFSYSLYQQHTFTLPKGFKGEVSGYYSGPGIWGGVFEYESTWALELGLQKKFLQDKLNVKLSISDLFYQAGWEGASKFNGLESEGNGNWDSRRGTISLSYNFGNQNVKSRKRKTGMEDEAGRVGK